MAEKNNDVQGLLGVSMDKIKQMVDVNTIVGDAVFSQDGTIILPVSKVCFGFVAGGGEYKCAKQAVETPAFAGGTGAGVTVQPMGFLVVGKESVRLLPAQYYAPVDRMIELAPQLMCEIKNALMKWCKKDGAENAAQPPVPPAP